MKIILAICLLLCATTVFSQPKANPLPVVVDQPAVKAVTAMNESEYYKQLYTQATASNDKLVTLTQWTVGISLTLVLSIIFSQVYFNRRLDNEAIERLMANLNQQFAELETQLITRIQQENAVVNTNNGVFRNEVRSLIESRITAIEQTLRVSENTIKYELLWHSRSIQMFTAQIAKLQEDINNP